MPHLEQIISSIKQAEAISRERGSWNPSQVGEIDIRIAADGVWYHEGRPFQRKALVKLFAGILQKQDDDYYLVTPVEKLKIQVDDAPFIATLVETIEQGAQSAIVFTTNIDDKIVLDQHHPIHVETDPSTGEPRPYIQFRDGIEALISRSAFYDLINMVEEKQQDGNTYFLINSLGQTFELGCVDMNEIE